jgi:putative membrane protein
LSSTSSAEPKPQNRSATEILASRYRHLFALPSVPFLLLCGGIASFFLSVLSRGITGAISFIPAFAVFVVSGSAISSALKVADKKTIATFRRAQALLLGSEILWLLVAAVGAVYAYFAGSPYPLTNALLFGAFVCAGFEFLVINGTFVKGTTLSLVLAALHPTATLLIVRAPELASHFDAFAASSGVLALALIVAFLTLLKRRKTSLGYDALSLFQAFMKTWAAGYSDELEAIITDHSEEIEVTTKVLRFRTKAGDIFLVLPGVHPGPFHPVGSYDLPGVISRAFKDLGPAITLHMPGGHERNLATKADTAKYALMVNELGRSAVLDERKAVVQGPVHAQIGKATVSASAFSDDMVMTVSFAPFGSDDLDTRMESELAGPASEAGFELSVVDAHNSIDSNLQSPETDDPGWRRLFEATKRTEPVPFSVAYSDSNELGFKVRGDLTENGMSLFLVQAQDTKSALVLADANNAVPNLRAEVAKALGSSGYGLIEFCTSDSHNLAARGLTVQRGYEALGEATPPKSIADLVVKMAKLAQTRLAPAQYGSAQTKSRVRVFGPKSLEEFAAITQSSSRFSRNYLKFAVAAIAVLLLASIVL